VCSWEIPEITPSPIQETSTASAAAVTPAEAYQFHIPRPLLRRMGTQSTTDLPDFGRAVSNDLSSATGKLQRSNHRRATLHKQHSRIARTAYNAQIMPQKVILIRHGQSMGNTDECLYSTTPDNVMPLTELGWKQARAAGKHLKEVVIGPDGSSAVHFIVSPYTRTMETFHGIVSAWCDPSEFKHIADRDERLKAWYGKLRDMGLTWREDPRIREQDFGNYQHPELVRQYKKERAKFGAFYYRFPHGESASDVFDRISTFLDSLWRSFDMHRSRHYVLITHGIAIRVLLTRYFRYTVDQFHLLANPQNCEMIVLEHDNRGRLNLAGRHELVSPDESDEQSPPPEGEEEEEPPGYTLPQPVARYRIHPRLRVLPEEYIRRSQIRISYVDDNHQKADVQ